MDVRLPDGRILRNVPEGTTRAQIAAKLGIKSVPTSPHVGPPAYSPPEEGVDWGRMGAEVLGGIAGGAAGIPAGPLGVVAGAGLGAEAGGQILDISRQYTGGKPIEGTLPERLGGAAKGVAVNAAGQAIGGKVAEVVGRGALAAARPLARRAFGTPQADIIQTYRATGVPVSVGTTTGNRFSQGTEEALAKTPGSHSVMTKYRNKFSEALSDEAKRVARASGGIPMGKEGTSQTIAKGARDAGKRFSERFEVLNSAIEKEIGRDTPVTPTNTAALLDEMQARYAADPKALGYLEKPIAYLRGIVRQGLPPDAAPDDIGQVSFGALRSARTHVGKSLDQPNVSGYVGDEAAQFRRIYGAFSEDVNDAAVAAGPAAQKALETANRYARTNLTFRMPALNDVNERANTAYKWLMSGSADTGARLHVMRQNLTSKEWDETVATTVESLGRATAGKQNAAGDVWSPETFLTRWTTLSDGAKKELFGGKQYAGVREGLDNLAKVSGSLRDLQFMKNPSGTAGQNFFMTMLSNPTHAIVGLGLMGIPQRKLANAFTNARFVNWLASGARIRPTNYQALGAHITRMPIVAGVNDRSTQQEEQSQ